MYKIEEVESGVFTVSAAAPATAAQQQEPEPESDVQKKLNKNPFFKLTEAGKDHRIRAAAKRAIGVGVIDDAAIRENIRSIIGGL